MAKIIELWEVYYNNGWDSKSMSLLLENDTLSKTNRHSYTLKERLEIVSLFFDRLIMYLNELSVYTTNEKAIHTYVKTIFFYIISGTNTNVLVPNKGVLYDRKCLNYVYT